MPHLMNSIEFNALYDFKQKDSLWTPYIGGGLGLSKVDVKNTIGEIEGTALTLQFKGGVSYKLDPKGSVFGEITFKGFGEVEEDDDSVEGLGSTDIAIGYRYNF